MCASIVWSGFQPTRLREPAAHGPHGRYHRRTVTVVLAKFGDDLCGRIARGEAQFRFATKQRPRIRPRFLPIDCHLPDRPNVCLEGLLLAGREHAASGPRRRESVGELVSGAPFQKGLAAVGVAQPNDQAVRQVMRRTAWWPRCPQIAQGGQSGSSRAGGTSTPAPLCWRDEPRPRDVAFIWRRAPCRTPVWPATGVTME